jgi:hypothetical protein
MFAKNWENLGVRIADLISEAAYTPVPHSQIIVPSYYTPLLSALVMAFRHVTAL